MIWQNEQEQKFFVPIIALWEDIDSSTFKEHRILRTFNLFFHMIESYKYVSLLISIIFRNEYHNVIFYFRNKDLKHS